jgi:hypothetical protein
MKNIIRLTESEIVDLIKRIIVEQETPSMDTLVGSSVRLFNTKSQDRVVFGEARIKSVVKDSDTRFTMDSDVYPKPTLMPGNPGPFRLKLVFDCSKEGIEVTINGKLKTFYNVDFENFCQNFCPKPKKRTKTTSF